MRKKLLFISGAIILGFAAFSVASIVAPQSPVVVGIKDTYTDLTTEKVATKTFDLKSFIDPNTDDGRDFIRNTYFMGGSVKVSNYDQTSTNECSLIIPQDRIRNLEVQLIPSDGLTTWVNFNGQLKKGEVAPLPPNKIGNVMVQSNILTSIPGPQAAKEVKHFLYQRSKALVKCYEELASQIQNAPLL